MSTAHSQKGSVYLLENCAAAVTDAFQASPLCVTATVVACCVQRHHITQRTEATGVRVSSLLLCLYAENRPHCASSIYPLPVTTSPAKLFQLSAGQRRGCTLENQFVAGSHIKTNNQCVSPGGSPGRLTHETP